MTEKDPKNPIEQLVELLVYAPVGLLYEHEEVVSQLVKRGRSQVQIAKVLAQMAAKQGRSAQSQKDGGTEDVLAELATHASTLLNRGITEFGQLVGLAPNPSPKAEANGAEAQDESQGSGTERSAGGSENAEPGQDSSSANIADVDPVADGELFPIADYDDLPARDIVPRLSDLSADQRTLVEVYELEHRGRKTILGKLNKLDD